MLTYNKKYFIFAILLFVIEALIAIYLKTGFIRHYVGDFLVVILIYCFVRSFFNFSIFATAVGVLLFAYFIEILQFLEFIEWIGLGNSKMANVVLGNYFEWADMVAYTLGIIAVLIAEKTFNFSHLQKENINVTS